MKDHLLVWIIGAVAVLVTLVTFALRAGSGGSSSSGISQKQSLLDEKDRRVINELERAFPQCRVHAQVGMGALLSARETSLRNRFISKRADFVLEDRTSGRITAIVAREDACRLLAGAGHVAVAGRQGGNVATLVQEALSKRTSPTAKLR